MQHPFVVTNRKPAGDAAGSSFQGGKRQVSSSQAKHQSRQETLENRLKKTVTGRVNTQLQGSANHHFPKAPRFKDLSRGTTVAAHRPQALSYPDEPLKALVSKCHQGQVKLNQSSLAGISSPQRGQSSAPATSGHQDPSCTSPGAAANPSSTSPSHTGTNNRRNQKPFHFLN